MSRGYRFDGPFSTLHLVPRGGVAPEDGVVVSPEALKSRLFSPYAPKSSGTDHEKERLFRDLGLPNDRAGQLDMAERQRLQERLHEAVARRFDVHEVQRKNAGPPPENASTTEAQRPDAPQKDKTHWIELQLVDKTTRDPLPGRPYEVTDVLGWKEGSGKLGPNGKARIDGLADATERLITCPNYPAIAEQDHRVAPGEHASGIAETFGFENFHDVWDDPSNSDIASLRKPHVLFAGDTVHIPAREATKGVKKPVDQSHVFEIDRSPLRLLVELHDNWKHPLAGITATYAGKSTTTDDDGLFSMDIEKKQRGGTLALPSKDLALLVGHLDPVTEDSGWRARLCNLGFMWDDDGGPEEDRIAIEDFQADQNLTITGELDDATRAKLLAAHGC